MTTRCPHCNVTVEPDELVDDVDGWSCSNCDELNDADADECTLCGLSKDASDYAETHW